MIAEHLSGGRMRMKKVVSVVLVLMVVGGVVVGGGGVFSWDSGSDAAYFCSNYFLMNN